MNKIEIDDTRKLILFKAVGSYSIVEARAFMARLRSHDRNIQEYHRFLNLREVESMNFTKDELMTFSDLVKNIRSNNTTAKACFLCKDVGTEKIAQIFLEFMKPQYVNNLITQDIRDCADYLEVELSILEQF